MAGELSKVSVCCPYCNASQKEPRQAQSTYCRACGQHFKIGEKEASAHSHKSAGPGLVTRLFRTVVNRPPRKVRCYTCGTSHEVSGYAASTVCPNCSAYIDLKNVVVSTRVTRTVDTRGHLHIERGGFLNNVSTICGSALLEGQINGRIYCDGPIRLSCKGRCSAEFIATKVVVEKGANVFVAHAVRAGEVVIRGQIAGRILCSGAVRIVKGGFLEGDVHARAFNVDKGGGYQGSISIGQMEPPQPPKDHPGNKMGFLGPEGLPVETQSEFPIR
ncbi:MAG: polymer-forming cytoskeletal protein [Chthoniobacterales bacterium]